MVALIVLRSSSPCSSSSCSRGRSGSCRRPGPASSSGSAATRARSTRADHPHPVRRPAPRADRPARAGRLLPAAAGDHRGQPGRDIDTVIYFQVTDPRAATYEIANYIQAIEQLTITTLRNVDRRPGPREDADVPRPHQRPAARRARRGDGQVGHPGQPGRAEGDRPAAVDPGLDGEADAGRPRQARRDPHRRGLKQSEILTAEGESRARSSRPRDSGRRRSSRPRGRRRRSTRSSRRSTRETPTRSCSPTSTCRCCRRSRRATRTRCGSSRAS